MSNVFTPIFATTPTLQNHLKRRLQFNIAPLLINNHQSPKSLLFNNLGLDHKRRNNEEILSFARICAVLVVAARGLIPAIPFSNDLSGKVVHFVVSLPFDDKCRNGCAAVTVGWGCAAWWRVDLQCYMGVAGSVDELVMVEWSDCGKRFATTSYSLLLMKGLVLSLPSVVNDIRYCLEVGGCLAMRLLRRHNCSTV